MEHIHVDVVELQQTQLPVERLARAVIPLLGITQLRCDPQAFAQLSSVNPVFFNARPANLIVVSRGTVDVLPLNSSLQACIRISDRTFTMRTPLSRPRSA